MGETDAVKKAKDILQGKEEAEPGRVLELVKELKNQKAFDYARKILARAREYPDLDLSSDQSLKLAQQQALCTYKDQNRPVDKRFDEALTILEDAHRIRGETLDSVKDQETLGQAGAIHKYRWEISGQKKHLEQSLNYYLRGYHEGVKNDFGYTAINAAFVLDLLASLESAGIAQTHPAHGVIETRRTLARQTREEIISIVPGQANEKEWLKEQWWFYATIAEAYFGLGQYHKAGEWFEQARNLQDVPDWEKESTARQLAALSRIRFGDDVWKQQFETTPAGKVLRNLVGKQAMNGMLLGKVGLALSGGGFRASLFHIGVLARLAETDMLRHVEVLSCVSGGSIIGAYYYLELRKLMKEKTDEELSCEDYIKIVHRISEKFLKGVQRNLRTRVAAEFTTNLKMIFLPNYSRTMRIGELYETELFRNIEDGAGARPRLIRDMFIKPMAEKEDFSPKLHNWRREAKVPMLILNATSLNTGHNWQFTASWMGEPTASIDPDIDANYRLRRMYYNEAPARHQNMRLGYAVAASSCVPGLFEPLSLAGLYPKDEAGEDKRRRIIVRLVDGGVYDNQGIASLLEQGCSVMLVSDASGQMESDDEPSRGLIGVPMRSNSILMSRVREAEYRELDARRESAALRGLMFIHLKKDLDAGPVSWITCDEPKEKEEIQRDIERSQTLTYYGVDRNIQKSLAAIRTDLDSFSDAEAYSLMLSGYRMTEQELPYAIRGFTPLIPSDPQWPFLAVQAAMRRDKDHEAEYLELNRLLKTGSMRAFRIWALSKLLKITAWIAGIALAVTLIWAMIRWSNVNLLTLGMVGSFVGTLILATFVSKKIVRVVRFRDTLIRIGIGIGMSLVGWIVARLHLHIFDVWFKKYGEINELKERVKK